jgi:cathepsin B
VREEDKNNEGLGMHATKLIGWGFDEATGHPYWLMMNSWDNWGIHGLGRVGVGEMNMEQGIAMVRM